LAAGYFGTIIVTYIVEGLLIRSRPLK